MNAFVKIFITTSFLFVALLGYSQETASSGITIPNIFTPNGDAINDVFEIELDSTYIQLEAKFFNRNGNEVYSWKGLEGHWDGRTYSGMDCYAGVYFYIIRAVTTAEEVQTYTGYVQLSK